STSSEVSLAYDGLDYAVVWQDNRFGNYEIFAARVSTSTGAKIGSDVRVTSDAAVSQDPTIVWDGASFGVAWYDTRTTGGDIYFCRLDSNLIKLGGDVQITNDISTSSLPCLAWTGAEYGVA